MARYVVKRLLLMVPTLLGVAVIIFFLMRVVPGDIVELRFAGEGASVSRENLDKERARLGLDEPLWKQFVTWIWGIVRLDFGTSMWTGAPITEEIRLRFALSLQLAVMATVVAVLIALPLGVRRAEAGQLARLRGANLRHRRAGHAGVLARHRAHPGPPDRVQVAASDGVHAVLGEPVAEHAAADLAGSRGRLSLFGGGDPDDALGDARGAPRGLHPDGARQGPLATTHPVAPRPEKRDAARADGGRPGVRLPHGRAGRHRAGIQPQRPRTAVRRVGGAPRLHAHAGARAARRLRLHLRQLPRGPGLRMDRSADPVPVIPARTARGAP